jgi:hypothetical protein
MMVVLAMGIGKHCESYASEPATGLSIRKSAIAMGDYEDLLGSYSAIFIH